MNTITLGKIDENLFKQKTIIFLWVKSLQIFYVTFFVLICIFYTLFTLGIAAIILFNRSLWRWRRNDIKEVIQILTEVIGKIVAVIFLVFFMKYFTIPYWKDVPTIVTQNFYYTEGYISKEYHKRKDFNEYVVVNGRSISFLISSKIERGQKYKITYLPNTNTGIQYKKIEQ